MKAWKNTLARVSAILTQVKARTGGTVRLPFAAKTYIIRRRRPHHAKTGLPATGCLEGWAGFKRLCSSPGCSLKHTKPWRCHDPDHFSLILCFLYKAQMPSCVKGQLACCTKEFSSKGRTFFVRFSRKQDYLQFQHSVWNPLLCDNSANIISVSQALWVKWMENITLLSLHRCSSLSQALLPVAAKKDWVQATTASSLDKEE